MAGKLEGRVALITGGSSGIGLATAKLFAREGATVIIVSAREEAVAEAIDEIGGKTTGYAGDVSDLAALDRIYAEVARTHEAIDILFANAGVCTVEPFEAVTEASYDRQFDINSKGLFFTVQKALPLMRDGGAILACSSTAHVMGNAGFHVYAGSKAAVRAFVRNWAVDLKDRRIRVNCLSPAIIETPLGLKMGLEPEALGALGGGFIAQMPLGRPGRVEEVAAAALFLLSDDSSFVTGTDLCVDGGLAQV